MRLIDAEKLADQLGRGLLVGPNLSEEKAWLEGYRYALGFALGIIADTETIEPTELGFVKADAILEDVNKRQYWIDRYQAPRFYITTAVRRAVRRLIERQTGETYHEEIKDE